MKSHKEDRQGAPWVKIIGGIALALGVVGACSFWVAQATLPNQLKNTRLTSATTVATTPTKIGELETALADITGIPINTDINAALFTVDAAGLKKVRLKDNLAAPTALGELLLNGTTVQFHDGTAARILVTRDVTETLTGKTLNHASNVLDADSALTLAANGVNCAAGNAPLGTDAVGAVEGCFDVATQAELDSHTAATTGTHGMGTSTLVGTALTQTLTNKTLNHASNVLDADTALALAANGTNCAANQASAGVDAAGNAEGCFDVGSAGDLGTHIAATAAHGATGAVVGTTNTQTLTNKTVGSGGIVMSDNAADPIATGQFVRNGTFLKYFDGANSRALVTQDTTETLFNKTIHHSNNVIDADTALALAANGANCTAGNAPLGVDAAGAAEGCFDAATQTELDNHIAGLAVHGATGAVVGTTNTQTLTNKTLGSGGVLMADDVASPTATGQLVRNGTTVQFHDGTAARTFVTRDVTETLTNKTLNHANNVIDADTALGLAANGANCTAGNAPLGVDAAGVAEGCFDVATQAELDSHTAATTGTHGMGTSTLVGTALTQTLTEKTISTGSIILNAASLRDASDTHTLARPTLSVADTLVTREAVQILKNKQMDVGTTWVAAADILEANNTFKISVPALTGVDTFATLAATQTLTQKTISGASNTFSNIPNTALKSATGSTASSTTVAILMNDYSFFPNMDQDTCTGLTTWTMSGRLAADSPDDTVGRFGSVLGVNCTAGTYVVRWRFLTASRDPEIVLARSKTTGVIVAAWRSEIELPEASPITFNDPDIEVVYLADFPNEWLTLSLSQVIVQLNSGQKRLGQIHRGGGGKTGLANKARGKGRVVIDSLPIFEVE